MVTVSHLVKKIVERKPFLEEALARRLISYAALANSLKPEIEKELGKKIKPAAIMMAIRRLSDELEESIVRKPAIRFKESDLTIKSGLFEITALKSDSIIYNIKRLYDLMNFSRGDFLAIVHGLHEVSIISNTKNKEKIERVFAEETKIKIVERLSSLTIKLPPEAVDTIGYFYVITKALNWENINIVEIVSTYTEMTFIIKEQDVPRAFSAIKIVIEEKEPNRNK